MSINNVLSLRAQCLHTLLREGVETISNKISNEQMGLVDFVMDRHKEIFLELANSKTCSLEGRTAALKLLEKTAMQAQQKCSDQELAGIIHKINKIKLYFINGMSSKQTMWRAHMDMKRAQKDMLLSRFTIEDETIQICGSHSLDKALSALLDLIRRSVPYDRHSIRKAIDHNHLKCLALVLNSENTNLYILGDLLNCAVMVNNLSAVKLLVEKGAGCLADRNFVLTTKMFPDSPDRRHMPLAVALFLGNYQISDYLLQLKTLTEKEKAKVYIGLVELVIEYKNKIHGVQETDVLRGLCRSNTSKLLNEMKDVEKFTSKNLSAVEKAITFFLDRPALLFYKFTDKIKDVYECARFYKLDHLPRYSLFDTLSDRAGLSRPQQNS
jgi:hypothetical protein